MTTAIAPRLLEQVLRPYKPNCHYLRAMTVDTDGGVRGLAELAIGESCYIDDTGHLNAVEVNIAYNQMLYYVIATAVRERLIPAFAGWTIDDYWRRQLPDILITKLTTRFRAPIDRSAFFGEFELRHATRRRLNPTGPALISLDTGFRFWDGRGGRADGDVTIAVSES